MKYTIHIGENPITLEHDSFGGSINVDDLTKIDTSNVYGEAVTMSAVVNRIGMMKSELMGRMSKARLDEKVFESKYKAKVRKEAANNNGYYKMIVDGDEVKVKVSETYLKTCFEDNEDWIKIREDFIKAEKQFGMLESLYWACQDKCRKLNGLVSSTTPEDFVSAMVEGKINGVLIKK